MTQFAPTTLTLADRGSVTLRSPCDAAAAMIASRKRVYGEREFLSADPEDASDELDE